MGAFIAFASYSIVVVSCFITVTSCSTAAASCEESGIGAKFYNEAGSGCSNL